MQNQGFVCVTKIDTAVKVINSSTCSSSTVTAFLLPTGTACSAQPGTWPMTVWQLPHVLYTD